MTLFPYKKCIIPLSWNADEAEHILHCFTKDIKDRDLLEDTTGLQVYKFNGWVKDQKFKVSKKVKYPQNYMPIAVGIIEETSNGSIVEIEFQLFPATKQTIWFSFIATLIFILIASIFKHNLTASLFILGLFLTYYIVVIANFNMHIKDCIKALNEVWEN